MADTYELCFWQNFQGFANTMQTIGRMCKKNCIALEFKGRYVRIFFLFRELLFLLAVIKRFYYFTSNSLDLLGNYRAILLAFVLINRLEYLFLCFVE